MGISTDEPSASALSVLLFELRLEAKPYYPKAFKWLLDLGMTAVVC